MYLMAAAAACLNCCGDLPPGFERTVVTDGLNNPISLEFLPDGNILIAERIGAIKLFQTGHLQTMLTLTDVSTDQEGGVLGMAVDPDFAFRPYVYLYYTSAAHWARIGRFTVVNGTCNPASELVIWQNPQPETGFTHHGGNLTFGSDGKLYLATGEETESWFSQDLSSQRGKILRMNRDGSPPVDNPYTGTPGAHPLVYALGFRNPFRCSFDPLDNSMYVGDVGQDTWEEISRIGPAQNGGWPDMEGPDCYTSDCSGCVAPLWSYIHCDPVYAPSCYAALIVGPVYRASRFPGEYYGSLFVADHVNNWIRRLVLGPQGSVVGVEPFASGEGYATIVDMKVGPDGALYYLGIFNTPVGSERLYRIDYGSSTDHAPVAVAGATPAEGPDAPLTVQFDGSLSTDDQPPPEGLTFLWDFDDGESSAEHSPQHTYTARGRYTARLTVSDGVLHGVSEAVVTVGHAPEVQVFAPIANDAYRAGSVIHFWGTATDAEDGALGPGSQTWEIAVVHDNHTHPFWGPVTGIVDGTFVIPATGHPPENTHYRVSLAVTDSDGIQTRAATDLVPETSAFQLDTDPPEIPMYLDGNPVQTPRSYSSLVGFNHHLSAQPTAAGGLNGYYFSAWSDGVSTPERTLVMPAGGHALTARYEPYCYSDFNHDQFITGEDFDEFINYYVAGDPFADVNRDDYVNGEDFDSFVDAFVAGC